MSQARVIAIIGAGFSGTMVAAHLATKARGPVEILLIERSGVFARGVAYGTSDSSHLLNIRASKMSALAEKPDHFVSWAKRHGLTETSFAPRRLYGDYLTEVLHEAHTAAKGPRELKEITDEVIGIQAGEKRLGVQLKARGWVQADEVILALGNFPAGAGGRLPFPREDGVRVSGAWDRRGLAGIGTEERVLILGSGLTMIDAVLTLKGQGHLSPIRVISRHGYLPHPFEPPIPCHPVLEPGRPLSSALRKFRLEEAKLEQSGGTWHSLLSSLRPITADLWRAMTVPERRRFLRHLKSLWETHRHQMAPEIAGKIKLWRADGSLLVIAGRILSLQARDERALICFRRRGESVPETFSVDHVVDCLGLEGNFATMSHPLIESLRRQRLIRPDPFGLGIEVTRDGRVIGGDGLPSERLFALGSLRRGECWESIAVPELRVQAEELAELLAGSHR